MEFRPLNITVISAEGIKDVNTFSKMDVYAVVSIEGYPNSKKKTFVDKDCGTRPKWNHRMEFVVDEPYLTKPGMSLLFQLKAEGTIGSDKDIGSVVVAIDELYKGNSSGEKTVEYQVRTPSGKSKGSLKVSYKFGEKFTQQADANKHADQPMMAYPTQPYAAGSSHAQPYSAGSSHAQPYPGKGYPQQYPPAGYPGYPQPGGYGYPPQPGYGYPPPMGGYGAYPPRQKPNKNKMGMGGLGLGLGAGLLGGLLVGDMVSDIGDAAAYADGYGDAMGDLGDF